MAVNCIFNTVPLEDGRFSQSCIVCGRTTTSSKKVYHRRCRKGSCRQLGVILEKHLVAMVRTREPVNEEQAQAGAEKLGVTWENARYFTRTLAKWAAAGFQERTLQEQDVLAIICRACDKYGEAVEADGWPEQCLCGCGGTISKREKRPPLWILWRMATAHCRDESKAKW